MKRFTRIKGDYSEKRMLPRLGKIRLGLKVKNQAGKEYPRETEHFVCPPEVEQVYGETPTELDVMLPLEDPEQIMTQKFALYGSGAGLLCHGNGVEAEEYNPQTKTWGERKCPCDRLKTDENPKGQCTPQTHLMVLLPKVSMGGCYQITTRSFNSTVALNSALDYIRAMTGRLALLPLKLRRVAQDTHHDGKKQVHYILNLVLDATLPQIADLRTNPENLLIPERYQIAGPIDENPQDDPVDLEVDDRPGVDAAAIAAINQGQLADLQEKLKAKQQEHAAPPTVPMTAKPASPPSEALAGSGPVLIDDSQWADHLVYLDDDLERATLKNKAKVAMGMDKKARLLDLPIHGRYPFITKLKELAAQEGVTIAL